MSRVDDDRQAQRLAEKLALEKRLQEERNQKKMEGESAFAKRLQQSGQEQQGVRRQHLHQSQDAKTQDGARRAEDGHLLTQETDASRQEGDAKSTREKADLRRGATAFGARLKQASTGEGERAMSGRLSDAAREGVASQGRAQDQQGTGMGAASRQRDAQSTQEAHQERGDGALAGQSALAARRGGGGDKGGVKADADGGGGQSGGQGKEKKDGGELAGGFRFNPALMAPVPVAKPKENRGSERLRALANEIAQKIVQSARVGTNAAGKAEFQIDLRSNVLAGLSIKVSGGNGKIRAVFQGSDREVLKLLRAEADTLKQALGGRGLTLEELRIEERA